jgi:hypothetical protein
MKMIVGSMVLLFCWMAPAPQTSGATPPVTPNSADSLWPDPPLALLRVEIFEDIKRHPQQRFINELAERGIIPRDSPNFEPEKPVTPQDFSAWTEALFGRKPALDTAPAGLTDEIRTLVTAVPGVASVEALKLRAAGPQLFAEIEIGVSRTMPLDRLSAIKEAVAEAVHLLGPLQGHEGAFQAGQEKEREGHGAGREHGDHGPRLGPPVGIDEEDERGEDVAHDQDGDIGRAIIGAVVVQFAAADRAAVAHSEIAAHHRALAAVRAAPMPAAPNGRPEGTLFGVKLGGGGVGHRGLAVDWGQI